MGFILALLTGLCFAISNILVRKGMAHSQKDNGVLTTLLVNLIVLGGAALLFRLLTEGQPITWQGLGWFALAGVFTTFLGRTTLFMSFRHIGPTRGTAVKNSAPMFTVLFAVLFLGEAVAGLPLVGIILVLCGLFIQGYYMVQQGPDLSVDKGRERKGYFIALTSAVVFGIGQAFRKPGMEIMSDPFLGAFISASVASILFLSVEARETRIFTQIKRQIKAKNIYYIGAGVFTSFAMICFFSAIMFIPVSYVAVVAALEPMLTIILSKLFLRQEEKIYGYTLAAAFTIVGGVAMIILFT
ncbi:DMT family transporter [Thalassorhabdus alkalitolerans]|uniref:DMT family transporter n=1 Tax=Thalassorhabdus alkalitolerans TaxID=2282697 RepID=A0ABW0YL80_9BACI